MGTQVIISDNIYNHLDELRGEVVVKDFVSIVTVTVDDKVITTITYKN